MKYISIKKTNGYYHVTVYSSEVERFLKTNDERAFIIMQIQQLLTARSVLEDPMYSRSLAHHIDLLAFSILENGIQLLAYCIDVSSIQHLIAILLDRLSQYQSEYQLYSYKSKPSISIAVKRLVGKHEAFAVSASIHLLHKDWEYDRYSSIGFYLHDRRGDWMRLWRLTQIYDNEPSTYLTYINHVQSGILQTKVLRPVRL